MIYIIEPIGVLTVSIRNGIDREFYSINFCFECNEKKISTGRERSVYAKCVHKFIQHIEPWRKDIFKVFFLWSRKDIFGFYLWVPQNKWILNNLKLNFIWHTMSRKDKGFFSVLYTFVMALNATPDYFDFALFEVLLHWKFM